MKSHNRFVVSLLLALVLGLGGFGAAVPSVQAQGAGEIKYNEPLIVSLAAGQSSNFTFSVLAGDSFELKLSRLAQYTYTAVLIDPVQNANPLQPGADGNVSVLMTNAPQGGAFTLVLSVSSGSGEMLIQLNSDSAAPVPLPAGQTTVDLTGAALRYNLESPATTVLVISDVPVDGAAALLLPAVTLSSLDTGEQALAVVGGMLPEIATQLPAGGRYLLTLEPGDLPQRVSISWTEATSVAASSSTSSASTDSSASSTSSTSSSSSSSGDSVSSTASTTGACQMVFSGYVNMRSGPGTDYEPPVAQIPAGSTLPVTGRNAQYSWYQVNYIGQLGWVSGQIAATQLQGNCTAVPEASYPAAPQPSVQQPVGPAATYTYTPSGPAANQPPVTGPTATYTPSYTPTTPPPAQVAPPDSNFNAPLDIPLDGTLTVQDYVSYPGGDTEDRVRIDVIGLNPNLALPGGRAYVTITATCLGTGTEYVTFFVSGQTYSCGEAIFQREVSYDNRTSQVTVTATGGENTYVQWILTGTAPRVK